MGEGRGVAREERAEWMTKVLAGTGNGDGGSVDSRLAGLEDMVFGEFRRVLTDDDGGIMHAIHAMGEGLSKEMAELYSRVDAIEKPLTDGDSSAGGDNSEVWDALVDMGAQLESTTRQIAVLAKFMERCAPFIRGMEDAFSHNEEV